MRLIHIQASQKLIANKKPDMDLLYIYGLKSLWLLDSKFSPIFGIGPLPHGRTKMGKSISSIWVSKKGVFPPDYRKICAIFQFKNKRKRENYIYMERDLDELNLELFNIRKVILFIVLSTTVLIIILLNFLLQSTITGPIKNIIKDINEIENGHKELLEGNYLKEFNYLINNFNKLLELTNKQNKELELKLIQVQHLNDLLSKYHEEMSKFEKLISIGELSAGVAHEIGNPLNNIVGYLTLMGEIIENYDDSELSDFLKRVRQEADRIDHIVRGMLEFSRKEGKPDIISVNLIKLIEKTIDLAELMMKEKKINVKYSYPEASLEANVDPNRFQQVLLNVLSNAIDSIENQGEITINVELIHDSKLYENELLFQKLEVNSKKFIKLTIQDNGSGIDRRDLKHVFDPFFTTKESGKGTGLGLSVSLQLIKEMNGILNIESEKGKGSIVTIILPYLSVS